MYFPIGTKMLVLFNKFTQTMASVYLFEPGNIDAPQLSVEQIESTYGPINLYSFYSDSVWAGFGNFGESIDYLFEGFGFQQDAITGQLTGMAGYIDGNAAFSIDDFQVSLSDLVEFTPGKPLAQLGIFDGSDYMSGSYGNDVLSGYRGADDMWGSDGDDVLRAGNGPDMIWGGNGSDELYGGFGRNTFKWEDDGSVDRLYIKSDQFVYNYIYDSAGNNPDGIKADVIYELDPFDQVLIQGVSTDSLSFSQAPSGIGIYSDGYLEAVYTGFDLSVAQIESMTSGVSV